MVGRRGRAERAAGEYINNVRGVVTLSRQFSFKFVRPHGARNPALHGSASAARNGFLNTATNERLRLLAGRSRGSGIGRHGHAQGNIYTAVSEYKITFIQTRVYTHTHLMSRADANEETERESCSHYVKLYYSHFQVNYKNNEVLERTLKPSNFEIMLLLCPSSTSSRQLECLRYAAS